MIFCNFCCIPTSDNCPAPTSLQRKSKNMRHTRRSCTIIHLSLILFLTFWSLKLRIFKWIYFQASCSRIDFWQHPIASNYEHYKWPNIIFDIAAICMIRSSLIDNFTSKLRWMEMRRRLRARWSDLMEIYGNDLAINWGAFADEKCELLC